MTRRESNGARLDTLVARVQELEQTLAEAKARWSNECAELQADRDFWDKKAGEEHAKVEELEREVARLRQAEKTGALCPQCGFETVTSSVTMEAFETVCADALARLATLRAGT